MNDGVVVDEAAVGNHGRWKPYPEYRYSGLDWLGDLPAHWDVRRLKVLASVRPSNVDKKSVDGQEPVGLCNYTDVYYNERITSEIEFMGATANSAQIRRFALRRGDVLITKDSESWTDIAVPALVADDLDDVLCGYHLALIRPRSESEGAFLARSFGALGPRYQFHVAAKGITRFGLDTGSIRTARFFVPPPEEQLAIVAFLDRETARIDSLIAKKERLIALLRESRATLISDCVWRGLTSHLTTKDTGLEWLGRIPATWTVRRLKHVALLRYGLGQPPQEVVGGVPLIRATNVKSGRIVDSGMMFVDADDVPVTRRASLREDDIVVVRSGAYTGDSAIVTAKYAGSLPGYDMVVSATRTHPQFLAWQLLSNEVRSLQFGFHTNRAAQPHLNIEQLGETVVTCPTPDEQSEIAAHLNRETARIDALVSKIRDHITLLREYRAALIAAAVTGKIDVRDEVAA